MLPLEGVLASRIPGRVYYREHFLLRQVCVIGGLNWQTPCQARQAKPRGYNVTFLSSCFTSAAHTRD